MRRGVESVGDEGRMILQLVKFLFSKWGIALLIGVPILSAIFISPYIGVIVAVVASFSLLLLCCLLEDK